MRSAAARGASAVIGLAPFPYSVVGGILPLIDAFCVLSLACPSVPQMARLPVFFGVFPFLYNTTLLASSLFQENEQINRNLLADPSLGLSLVDEIYLTQYNTIVELASKGPCVIVGHGAGGILKDRVPILNVFIYADFESRKKRAIEEYGESKNKVEKKMMDIDKKRSAYFKFYTGVDGKQMDNYQLCLHSGQLGISSCVEIIQTAYNNLY